MLYVLVKHDLRQEVAQTHIQLSMLVLNSRNEQKIYFKFES